MKSLHIAVAQIHSAGPVTDTLRRVECQVKSAAAVGVQAILFSECALQGYDYDMTAESVREIAVTAESTYCRQIMQMANNFNISVLIGFFERCGDDIHNSMLVAYPDGRYDVTRKHALTGGEIAAKLTPGQRERLIVDLNGVRCAIIICADGGIEGLHEDLRARGADYRLCPTGGGGKISDMLHESDLQTPEGRQRYSDNRPRVFNTQAILDDKECPNTSFASANALGPVGAQTCHQGHCMIVDNQHVMRAQIPGTIVLEHMQDQMVHAVLNF